MRVDMFLTSLLFAAIMVGCGGSATTTAAKNSSEPVKETSAKLIDKITSPKSKDIFTQGDDITFTFKAAKYDSLAIYFDGERLELEVVDNEVAIPTNESSPVGRRTIKLELYSAGESQTRSVSFSLMPLREYQSYKAEIINSLPHDKDGYTQGLEFSKGRLIESSGQYELSYLAELEFPSMRELRRYDLEDKYFAEGITVLDNKIYMLTWQENTGFIFDRDSFEVIGQWNYPTEGWGLTNDGEMLYMSDGSKYIYVVDPATMKNVRRIEVVWSKGQVNMVNELEWIDGRIWANLYGTNYIFVINPQTGAVEATINCNDLAQKVGYGVDVLNGIAQDPATKKIYATGKLWPNIFEITLRKQ